MLTVKLSLAGVNIGDFLKIYFKIFFEFSQCSKRQYFVIIISFFKNLYIISVLTGKKKKKNTLQFVGKSRIGYDYI